MVTNEVTIGTGEHASYGCCRQSLAMAGMATRCRASGVAATSPMKPCASTELHRQSTEAPTSAATSIHTAMTVATNKVPK